MIVNFGYEEMYAWGDLGTGRWGNGEIEVLSVRGMEPLRHGVKGVEIEG